MQTDSVSTIRPEERVGRGALLLILAQTAANLLRYAFVATAARVLTVEDFGKFGVLMSLFLVLLVLIGAPIQVSTSRFVSLFDEKSSDPIGALRSVAKLAAAIALLLLGAGALLRGLVTEHLFDGDDFLFAALVLSLGLFMVDLLFRGFIWGLREFGFYAAVIIVAQSVRLLLLATLVLGLGLGLVGAGTALIAAPAAGAALGALVTLKIIAARPKRDRAQEQLGMAPVLRFTIPLFGLYAGNAIMLNAGPLLLKSIGGGEGGELAARMFAAFVAVSAPLYVFDAIFQVFLPTLTRLAARGDERGFRRYSLIGALLVLAGSAGIIVGAAWIGPSVLQWLYGPGFQLDRLGVTILAVAVSGLIASGLLNVMLLARGHSFPAAIAWLIGAMVLVGVSLSLHIEPLRRVEYALLGASGTIFLLLALSVFGWRRAQLWGRLVILRLPRNASTHDAIQ